MKKLFLIIVLLAFTGIILADQRDVGYDRTTGQVMFITTPNFWTISAKAAWIYRWPTHNTMATFDVNVSSLLTSDFLWIAYSDPLYYVNNVDNPTAITLVPPGE